MTDLEQLEAIITYACRKNPLYGEELIKQVRQGAKAIKLIHDKMEWSSPWKDTMTENGRIYQCMKDFTLELSK